MKQFMAGDIGPGEMGCGIELMVRKIHTIDIHTNTQIQMIDILTIANFQPASNAVHSSLLQDMNPLVAKEKEDMYQVRKSNTQKISP